MAGIGFMAVTGEIATGTSAKTLVQVVAASNHRILIRELSVSFQGTNNAHPPIKVDVMRQTDAGTTSALTPVKLNSGDGETLQTTARHTATVEPSAGDVIMSELVHPQTGFIWQAPFGGEIPVVGGGRLAIRVTASNDVDAIARMVGEE
jgi:hypothetical protein